MEVDDVDQPLTTSKEKTVRWPLRSVNLFPMEGTRVLILRGRFQGTEGICLGEHRNGRFAVSPDGSDEILSLARDREFGLLIDLSADPLRN